jgi:hypothetical protein
MVHSFGTDDALTRYAIGSIEKGWGNMGSA